MKKVKITTKKKDVFSASSLRADIYNILDHSLQTGTPIRIERNGKILTITPERQSSKISNIKKMDLNAGNSDEIASLTWEKNWNTEDDIS